MRVAWTKWKAARVQTGSGGLQISRQTKYKVPSVVALLAGFRKFDVLRDLRLQFIDQFWLHELIVIGDE